MGRIPVQPPRWSGFIHPFHPQRLRLPAKHLSFQQGVRKSRGKLGGGSEAAAAGGAYVPTVFVGVYATQGRYNVRVSKLKHYYGLNHLHYLTTGIPQGGIARPSAGGFDSERFRKQWVATSGELGRELKFRILGYVLMPEYFHALIWPTAEANSPQIMQKLGDRGLAQGAALRCAEAQQGLNPLDPYARGKNPEGNRT